MSGIRDSDPGFKEALGKILAADGIQLKVGILSGRTRYSNGEAVAKVAAIHESRGAWMRQTIDTRERRFASELQRLHAALLEGRDPIAEAEKIGESVRDDMREEIERQGLVETGKLRDSIDYRVSVSKTGGKG